MKANTYDIKFTRITRFLLGNQSPRLFTQLVFYISLPVVFWYLMFFSFTLVAMRMVDALPNANQVHEGIFRLGEMYSVSDMKGAFLRMSVIGLVSTGLMIAGILFLWRRWKIAYSLILPGIVGCLFCPWIFFGSEYFSREQSSWEWALPSTLCILVIIDWATRGK